MKKLSYVIAISMFVSGTAFAATPSAIGALKAAAGPERQSDIPLPVSSTPSPDKTILADVMDLSPNYSYVVASYAEANGYTVFSLDGSKMTTKEKLMAHVAAQLRLPAVPANWDALADYLRDLPYAFNNARILIVVRKAEKIYYQKPQLYADFRGVAESTSENARDWSRGGINIKFAFAP